MVGVKLGVEIHISPALVTESAVSDKRLEFAVEQGVEILKIQDTTLGNVRNRAAGTLAAASLVTSIAAGLAVKQNSTLSVPRWTVVTLLVILVIIGISTVGVQWSVKRWGFGLDPRLIVKRIDEGCDEDALSRYLIDELIEAMKRNDEAIKLRLKLYRLAATLLVAEVAVFAIGISFYT